MLGRRLEEISEPRLRVAQTRRRAESASEERQQPGHATAVHACPSSIGRAIALGALPGFDAERVHTSIADARRDAERVDVSTEK